MRLQAAQDYLVIVQPTNIALGFEALRKKLAGDMHNFLVESERQGLRTIKFLVQPEQVFKELDLFFGALLGQAQLES